MTATSDRSDLSGQSPSTSPRKRPRSTGLLPRAEAGDAPAGSRSRRPVPRGSSRRRASAGQTAREHRTTREGCGERGQAEKPPQGHHQQAHADTEIGRRRRPERRCPIDRGKGGGVEQPTTVSAPATARRRSAPLSCLTSTAGQQRPAGGAGEHKPRPGKQREGRVISVRRHVPLTEPRAGDRAPVPCARSASPSRSPPRPRAHSTVADLLPSREPPHEAGAASPPVP